MSDELRIYHIDDPCDAPERRMNPHLPTINPLMPTSLPKYVIPPVANSLYTAMQYYWYQAYHQGIRAQKEQHQQLLRQQQEQEHQQLQQHHHHHQQQQQQHLQQQQLHQHHQQQQQQTAQFHTNHLQQAAQQQSASPSSSTSSGLSSTSTSAGLTTSNSTSHIKKPLNPFMIFMKQIRPLVIAENEVKESSKINTVLGERWRKLTREQQEPYYKMAEEEKERHRIQYPGWSARDNYANQKKKKKMKQRSISLDLSDKKCRARFGLNNMASWCKPCKRKKKCIYSKHHSEEEEGEEQEENSQHYHQNHYFHHHID